MSENTPVFMEEYLKLHAADLADRLQRLDTDEARTILRQLPADKAAAALAEVEEDRLPDLLAAFDAGQLSEILRHIAPADAADLLQQLSPGLRRDALAKLPAEVAGGVRKLLRYPEDTAGGIMSNRFIVLPEDMAVEQVRELLRDRAQEDRPEDIAYLYVQDKEQRLIGIVSLRDLVFSRAERRMNEIMNRDVKFTRVTDDQEELARKFEHYHYLGLPVLDADGRLVGVVKASDALEVATKEATEDMQLMVGLSGEEHALTPWQQSIRVRLPWLYVNLATAFLAAFVVGLFEGTIAKFTALAVLLPVVAGQSGNSGMQALAVTMRGLALREVRLSHWPRLILKEAGVGILNGVAVATTTMVGVFLWSRSIGLTVVIGSAMILAMILAGLAGASIPLILKAAGQDPAQSSSIVLTTITDCSSFLSFLGLATILLGFL